MAITQANKNPGELLRSSDWNELLTEAKRLDEAKFDKSGGAIVGNLSVSGALAVGTTQFSGSLNVASSNPVQLRLQQTSNTDWARLAMNANGNEWHLAVGSPGTNASANVLNIYSATANRNIVSLGPTGNAGIGVDAPNSTLHVRGGNWDVSNNEGDLKIGNDTHRLKIGVALAGGGVGDVRIRAMGGSNRLILGGGNSDLIHMNDTSGINIPTSTLSFGAQVRQMINLWNTNYGIGVQNSTFYYRSDRNFVWYINGSHHDGELNPGTGGTLAMALRNTNLEIAGSISNPNPSTPLMFIYQSGTSNAPRPIAVHSPSFPGWGMFYIDNGDQFQFTNGTTNAMLVNLSGGVEISDLSVTGVARKTGGGSWAVLSDARLKQDVVSLTGALDQLLRLRGVSFEWQDAAKVGERPGRQRGLIAQEVEQVFPEWINVTREGHKTVGVHGFEALVVEALRELKGEIDALKQASQGV